VALLALVSALVAASGGPGRPRTALAVPDHALDTLWTNYGDEGGHWTGGDRTASVALPDGRIVWLFSDTFLGPVNPDHSRPGTAPFVHNSMVVERDGKLGPTLTSGTAARPGSLVNVPGGIGQYWVGSATVEGNQLRVLYNLLVPQGNQALQIRAAGTALATFALPSLTLVDLHTLPLSADTAWGSSILTDGDWTYIYGSEHNGDGPKYAHVARVPRDGLSGAWQFWTGRTWSDRESDSARLLSGVGTAYSVVRTGSRYVLVTMDTNLTFNPSLVVYQADTPTGPFGPPTVLLVAPEAGQHGRPIIVYDATVHPELGDAGRLVVSYNVNSLDPEDDLADVAVYRPRFVDVAWPLPAPPGNAPPAPTGLTATTDSGGLVSLSWAAGRPVNSYHVYERDVSFGQTYPARLPADLIQPAAQLPYLHDGHTYEFAVSSVVGGVEGPPTAPVRVTVHMRLPATPTGLTATADPSGQAVLRWSPAPSPVWYSVYQADVTAGDVYPHKVETTDTISTSVAVGPLINGHIYLFAVSASNGKGESPATAPVQVTAIVAPPGAPTRLQATPHPDGSVTLAWAPPRAPGHGVTLFGQLIIPPTALAPSVQVGGGAAPTTFAVFQRDVTAGQTQFSPWPFPVATTQVDATTLLSGHTYEFTVSASNSGGSGPLAAPVQVTATGGLPAAPTGLTAVAGDQRVTLSWTGPADPTVLYLIYRRDITAGDADYVRFSLPVTSTTLVDYGLVNGDNYLYQVAASNVHGEGARSTPVLVRPVPDPPGAPQHLTAVAGDASATLTWSPPGPGTFYYLIDRRDVTTGGAFRRFPLPVMTGPSFRDVGLTNGHTYEYRVAASNLGGEGPPSTVVTVRPVSD
jgi:hypothetical protein